MKKLLSTLLLILALLLPASAVDNLFRNGDVFEMRLSGPPEEFTREFNLVLTVDEESVNVPLIGRVRATGLSSTQLAQSIEKRLKDEKIFTNPTVNITMNQVANARTIIIGGAVRAPGRQPWMADLTLTGAMSAGGGPNEWAGDGVKIIRGGRATKYSRKALRKDPSLDPKIQPGDIIEVEES